MVIFVGSFLEVFGDITIYQIALFIMAVGYVIEKAKNLYIWITTHHDGKQEQDVQLKAVVATVQQQSKDIDLLKCANLATLNYHLFAECERVLNNKEITINDLEKIKRLYYAYHNLGGNGVGTKLYGDVLVLPLKR